MVNKFCPNCGKALQKNELCTECKPKNTDKIELRIQVSEFNRMFHNGSWHSFLHIDDAIVRRVKEVLGQDTTVDIEPFEFEPIPKAKTLVKATGHSNGQAVPIHIKLSYMQCDYGQKQKTGYYEGILQLRNPNDDVQTFLSQQMIRLAPKGVFISKTVPQKKGVDLYFTNKTQMQLLGQKIVDKFGGTISNNAQLFSHNHLTSKDIYRLNVLVTLPEFTKGDVITFDYLKKGIQLIKVTKMGKIMQGTDLVTSKTVGFELKNCQDISSIPKQETTIMVTQPQISVMDPDTYQESQITNPPTKTFKPGQKVSIVKTNKGVFIV